MQIRRDSVGFQSKKNVGEKPIVGGKEWNIDIVGC